MAWFNISPKHYESPLIASFDITYECNLRCDMCYVWGFEEKEQNSKNLSAQKIIEAANNLHKSYGIAHFRFLGGEPLLREDLPQIIRSLSSWAITEITTNGTLLTEKICKSLIEAGLTKINISLDGPKENNIALRGEDVYATVLCGIDTMISTKKQLNAEKPFIKLGTVVTKLNYMRLEEVIKIAEEKKVGWGFWPMHKILTTAEQTVWNGKNCTFPHHPSQQTIDLMMNRKELKQYRKNYHKLKKRYSALPKSITNYKLIKPLLQSFYYFYSFFFHTSCNRIRKHMLIGPMGNIIPCEFLRSFELGSICNLKEHDVWFSKERKEFYKKVRCGKFDACNECNRIGTYRGSAM